jgi:hypothetical protein
VALDCDHPRANISLPPKSPARLNWQPPAIIPGLPPEAQRVIRESLQGIYDELTRLAAPGTVVPLLDDIIYALPGQTIQGVGNGQQIVLPIPHAGTNDPVTVVLEDVISPVTVTSPDGTSTTIGTPGPVEYYPGADDGWVSSSAQTTLDEVPTDRLVGRDSPGVGPSEYIAVTGGLEFTGTEAVQIAADGVTNAKLRDSAALSVIGRSAATSGDPADIVSAGARRFLASNSFNSLVSFRTISILDFPTINHNRFIGNISGATAVPVAIDFYSLAQDNYGIGWDVPTSQWKLSDIVDNYILGNVSGVTARPIPVSLATFNSPTFVYDNTGKTFFRPALTGGDVTAPANNNVLTVVANAVTNAKLAQMAANTVKGNATASTTDPQDISVGSNTVLGRQGSNIVAAQVATAQIADNAITDPKLRDSAALSLIGRSPNSIGDPADIATTAGSNAVLRESGSALSFGTVATGGIADNAVTNAKAADMAARTVKGRADSAGTGDPQDLTGLQLGSILRLDAAVGDTTSSGSIATYTVAEGTTTLTFNSVTVTIHGVSVPAERGQILFIRHIGSGTCTLIQESGTATNATERLSLGDALANDSVGIVLGSSGGTSARSVMLIYTGSRWQRMDDAVSANAVGGAQLTSDAVDNTKLANMVERRIKGRANGAGTGDPQDLTGAQVGAILRFANFTGDTTTTGTVTSYSVAAATNMVTFNAVTNVIHGMTVPAETGQILIIQHIGAGTTTIVHESTSSATAAERFRVGDYGANTLALVLDDIKGLTAKFIHDGSRWIWIGGGALSVLSVDTTHLIDDGVTNTKLANMAAGTAKGRALGAGTGDPQDVTGAQQGEMARRQTSVADSTSTGSIATYTIGESTTQVRFTGSAAATIHGMTATASTFGKTVEFHVESGVAAVITFPNESGSAGGANERLRTPSGVDVVLRANESVQATYYDNRWRFGAVARRAVADADYGDITVTVGGTTWTVDNDVVSNAKLANMAVGTVKGRQIDAGSTGDPVDLTGAEQGENLRVNTRQTVSASGTMDIVLNDDTTILVLQLTADTTLRSLSNTAAGDGRLVRVEHDSGAGFTLTFGHNMATPTYFPLYTSDEADMAVRRGATTTFRARSGFWRPEYPSTRMRVRKNSTGTVFDRGRLNLIEGTGVTLTVADDATNNEVDITITGGVVSDGDKGDVTVSSTGTVWTIDNDVVSNAKAANMAQSTLKGRAEGAGTGDPTDLTPTQVVAVIDGESPVWSASHRFDSFVQFGTSTALPSSGDVRKAGAIEINSADDINLIASDNCTVDISNTLTLDGGAEVALVSGNKVSLNATSGLQFGSTTGMPIGGDIRKGSASVLDIRSSNGIQLCGLGGVAVYGSTPANGGLLLIGDGASGNAGLIATPIAGATNPELQMQSHVGTEGINNVCRGVNNAFSTTITGIATQVALVPSVTIPAGSWRVGRTFTAIGHVVFSRGATATACNMRSIHGLSGGFTETLDLALPTTTAAGYAYRLEYSLTCLSVGASGTFMQSMRIVGGENGLTASCIGSVDLSPHSVDTTASQTISILINMTTNVANLSMTRTIGYLTRTF